VERITRTIEGKVIDNLNAGNWMTPYPHIIEEGKTYREAATMMEKLGLGYLPVINELGHVVGMVTLKQLVSIFLKGNPDEQIKRSIRTRNLLLIQEDANLLDLSSLPHKYYVIVDEKKKLIGILTNQDILDAFSKYIYKLKQTENTVEVLSIILDIQYSLLIQVCILSLMIILLILETHCFSCLRISELFEHTYPRNLLGLVNYDLSICNRKSFNIRDYF